VKTQFAPLTGLPVWARHRAAGDAWLGSYFELGKVEPRLGIFYVEPFALAFSLELFVKALVGFDDPSFDAKKANHGSAAIIKVNTNIPTLEAIAADAELMEIIEEYGKATAFKYGELGMMIDRDEQQKVLDAVLRIRSDLEERMEKTRPSAAAITAAVPCSVCNAAAGEHCKFDGDPDVVQNPPKIHTARIPPGWVNPGP
jgi:hypothetical protein